MEHLRKARRLIKGKGTASSSSQQPKKRQLIINEESDEERNPQQEEEMELDDDSNEKPDWRIGTLLHTFPSEWQLLLFKEKMGGTESIKKQLICERKTILSDFRGFELVECFEKMGWMQGLVWNNNDDPEVYLEGIIEWMGTLERIPGSNPPETMKLVGTVNQKKVTMSFATLDKIAKFDSGSTLDRNVDYLPDDVLTGAVQGDNWISMIDHLFTFPDASAKLERHNLKPLPRLIMSILNWNVCPRTSDRAMIRFNEIIVLYALTTGNLALSLRQIIMLNIWDARNKRNKTILPHPRLITSLIKLHKAIPKDAITVTITQVPFSLSRLTRGNEWRLEETPQARLLREVRGPGCLIAPKEGFTRAEVIAELQNRGGGDVRGATVDQPRVEEGESGRRDAGLLGREPRSRIERPEFYAQWSPFEQNMWDLTTRQAEEARDSYEERRRYERGMVYAHELDVRRRFDYEENVRHHQDYISNLPYVEVPPQYNYQTLDPYSGDPEMQPHYPQSHDSDWLPRHSSVARMEGNSSGPSSSSTDPFETRTMYTSLMESIFGPARQPQ